MSAAPMRQTRPHPRPAAPTTAPATLPQRRDHLQAVSAPQQGRSLVPFAWGCVAIIIGALAGVLMLNTTMAQGAYERRDLKIELAELHQERAALITQLEANSAPQHLSSAARELGMVPAGASGVLSLEESAVWESGERG